MNTADLLRAFASGVVDQNNRPIRLNWGQAQRTLEQVLALQYADIREGLMTGIAGHLTCVSARADLPIRSLIGLPVSVQMTTDRGRLHAINGIVTDVRAGQSDGSLACYQLTIRDVLSVMERRTNSRIFRSKSLPDILDVLLHEWRQRSPVLARAFEFDLSGLRRERYPARELTRQVNESDAHFIRRLLRRDGATVFAKAGKSGDRNDGAVADTPIHTLVFTDDPMKLPETEAGTVRYHRDAATEARDSITLWATRRSLIPGSVARPTWDYKNGRMSQTEQATIVDQGEAGNDIAHLLADAVIDIPHAGDSSSDLDRIGKDRMLAHELRAESVDGAGGVRDLAVGHWFTLAEHPQLDTLPVEQRQFIVTSLHHRAQNNLPKELNARAQSLFAASRALFDAAHARAFQKTRTEPFGGESKCRGGPIGQRIAVALHPDAARDMARKRGFEFEHGFAVDHRLVREAVRLQQRDTLAAGGQLVVGFGDLELAGGHKAAVLAEQIGHAVPDFTRHQRKRNFRQRAPERAHAARIHPRRMTRDVVGFEHDDLCTAAREMKRAARAVQPAADHQHVGFLDGGRVIHRRVLRA